MKVDVYVLMLFLSIYKEEKNRKKKLLLQKKEINTD